MPNITALKNRIFNIVTPDDFNDIAIEIFHFQYKNNYIYKQFVDFIKKDISKILHYSQIPFIPVEFFKSQKVVSGEFNPEIVFTSSGTSGIQTSNHFVKELNLYDHSFLKTFSYFFGNIDDYVILALLPSYLERTGSSLIYMTDRLIADSKKSESGFYLDDYNGLNSILLTLKSKNQKVILLGVTYALLDLVEQYPINFPDLIVMETGGMKGMRKELIREELHYKLRNGFGMAKIYSEYGMTELLSQSYSKGNGVFSSPPWMKIVIRDVNDPLSLMKNSNAGGINVIDFANLFSCSFIATQDLGKVYIDGSFEILGRFDNSDIRGCNLLVN